MAAKLAHTPIEGYWNTQSDTLREIREHLGYENYQAQQFKPLPDRHPLLQNAAHVRRKPVANPRRHSLTPPKQLPKMRGSTPPERNRHNSPNLRGSKYDIVPPLQPKRAFASPLVHKKADDDSWGEDESSDEDDNPMDGMRGYPYPMMMYPYPMMMAPPPQASVRKSKSKKDGKAKKKVHYRNTPVYLSSREHTKHDPKHRESHHDPFDPRTNSVLERYSYPAPKKQPLSVTDHWDLVPDFPNDFVETFVEECLDDVIIPDLLIEVMSERDPMPQNHPFYPSTFFYCEDFLDEEIPNIVREVVQDASHHMVDGHLLHQEEKRDPLEEFLSDLLDDVINNETSGVVKEVAKDIVADHMEKATAYDEIQDMIGEVIHEVGPDLVEEALLENIVEDMILEEMVEPEVKEQSQEVAVDILTHYSNKVRNRDVRELKKNSGEKLMDAILLDYLLANIARQGELWTEGEHANKLLDEITLNIVLTEFLGVQQKRRATVDNKPVRRYYEKIVTDVTLDVLLEEISQSLDEDMADLDEYEQEIENPDVNYEMPKDLKKWLDGR